MSGNTKRNIVVATMAVLVCAAVGLNWKYSGQEAAQQAEETGTKILGEAALVSGQDIITRGFVYVKESEGLMDELRQVALDAILDVDTRYATDWSAIKQSIKADLSNYLYKKTKRSPMILPVIMEV